LGITIEHPDYLWRIDELLKCPAALRFVSCEPLLGPIDLTPWLSLDQWLVNPLNQSGAVPATLDWILVGGESGPEARPMHPQWARDIRDQCLAAGVPFFFKQWGAWAHIPSDTRHPLPQKTHWCPDRNLMGRVGKKRAGPLLDGQEWREFPKAFVDYGVEVLA